MNKPLYWDKVVALPTKDDFEVQFMSAKDKQEFDAWYKENIFEVYIRVKQEYESRGRKDDLWYDVFEENLVYCPDDVRVLRVCIMKFFEACQATIKIMPGVGNMTIASYCNKVWRTNFLEKDTVGPSQKLTSERCSEQNGKTWLAFLDTCHHKGRLRPLVYLGNFTKT